MSRMIDRLLLNGYTFPPGGNNLSDQEEWRKEFAKPLETVLPIAEVFMIDNVADYFFTNGKEMLDLNKDFPNTFPPFENMWTEWRYPSGKVNENIIPLSYQKRAFCNAGVHFISHTSGDGDEIERSVWAGLYLEWHKGIIRGPVGFFKYITDYNGVIKENSAQMRMPGFDPYLPNAPAPFLFRLITILFFPSMLAISLLHCKNVTIEPNYPPAALNKSYQKKHGRPMVKYYTLNIKPMKEVLRREGNSETTGLKHALHICRGHFKDYSDKGLFGKYKGMYWWDSHVRGTVEQGAVIKDYNIKAPSITP